MIVTIIMIFFCFSRELGGREPKGRSSPAMHRGGKKIHACLREPTRAVAKASLHTAIVTAYGPDSVLRGRNLELLNFTSLDKGLELLV